MSSEQDRELESDAFERWLSRTCPYGDVESVQRQWEESTEFADFIIEANQAVALAKGEGKV